MLHCHQFAHLAENFRRWVLHQIHYFDKCVSTCGIKHHIVAQQSCKIMWKIKWTLNSVFNLYHLLQEIGVASPIQPHNIAVVCQELGVFLFTPLAHCVVIEWTITNQCLLYFYKIHKHIQFYD